nr:hypothetical protein [Tanacetum cinerariifolium]
ADYNEYKISEVDFKNLHPNDFKDMCLLHLQGKLNNLPGSEKVHLTTQSTCGSGTLLLDNVWENCNSALRVIRQSLILLNQHGMLYSEENELHKFSDGTLTRVLHKLDHMVKDFRLYQYNPGMENRNWSEDDKRRSEEFMEVIERRLKI